MSVGHCSYESGCLRPSGGAWLPGHQPPPLRFVLVYSSHAVQSNYRKRFKDRKAAEASLEQSLTATWRATVQSKTAS
eukprot:scaffold488586_cov47-Prasinocladus_malaysianus.AAC.1